MTISLFLLAFFSIPSFSFIGAGKYVTWVVTIFLLTTIAVSLALFYPIKIDILSISLLFFVVSAFLSSAITAFKSFKITPYYLAVLIFLLYTYFRSVKKTINLKSFIFAAYIGTVLFLFFYIVKYRNEILSLSFERLGKLFGDENDIALFLSFGAACSLYYFSEVNKTNIVFPFISMLLFLLFAFCGFTTGSKIFILVLFLSFIFIPFKICGKKKWWIALLIIIIGLLLFYAVIHLPFMYTIKQRFYGFISTLLGISVESGSTREMSTVNRLDMFLCGIEMWLKRPMFGWGSWGFATYSGATGGWSHNNFSESLCNFGLVGTVLFNFGFIISFISYFSMCSVEKKKYSIMFFLLLFYIVAMFGVALNSQKLYAYVIGVVFAGLTELKTLMCIDLKTMRLNKKGRKDL